MDFLSSHPPCYLFQGYFLSLDIGQSNVPVGDEVSRQVEMLGIVGLRIDLKAVVILRIVRDESFLIGDASRLPGSFG